MPTLKQLNEGFSKKYLLREDVNKLQTLADKLMNVNSPQYRGAQKPDAKLGYINEINIPDNMRGKYWNSDLSGNEIKYDWLTQEQFDEEDYQDFRREFLDCVEYWISELEISEPVNVHLVVECRDGESYGFAEEDFEFNGDGDLGESLKESFKIKDYTDGYVEFMDGKPIAIYDSHHDASSGIYWDKMGDFQYDRGTHNYTLMKYKNGELLPVEGWPVVDYDLTNESLKESSLTPKEKMQAWHDGNRKENIKACGTNKLMQYLKICKELKFDNEVKQIKQELINRGMPENSEALKETFGRSAVSLDQIHKQCEKLASNLPQDSWAKETRYDYVKRVYHAFAGELEPIGHIDDDGRSVVYRNDDKNEFYLTLDYIGSALHGNLAPWYAHEVKISTNAPMEWQQKVNELIKKEFTKKYPLKESLKENYQTTTMDGYISMLRLDAEDIAGEFDEEDYNSYEDYVRDMVDVVANKQYGQGLGCYVTSLEIDETNDSYKATIEYGIDESLNESTPISKYFALIEYVPDNGENGIESDEFYILDAKAFNDENEANDFFRFNPFYKDKNTYVTEIDKEMFDEFIENDINESWDDYEEDKYTLVGVNGNAFAVMGYVANALRAEGLKDLINQYRQEAMSSDYNNLLVVSMDYLEKANEAAREMDESLNEDTGRKLFKEYKILVDGRLYEISHTKQRMEEIVPILKNMYPDSIVEVKDYKHYESGYERQKLERLIDKQLKEYGMNESIDEEDDDLEFIDSRKRSYLYGDDDYGFDEYDIVDESCKRRTKKLRL